MENKLVKKYAHETKNVLLQTLTALSEETQNVQVNKCDSEQLLHRNTESFRCLTQHLLSSSSLAKNRLFLFPPLQDPGISVAFNFIEPVIKNDQIGVEKYLQICEELKCVSLSAVTKALETDTLDLKFYGLTLKQLKSVTETLKVNSHVTNLILEENLLMPEMVSMIGELMIENTTLNYLSLQKCNIGKSGAEKLGEVLSSLQSLRSLNLSFNDIGDEGLLMLQDGLCSNSSLKTLDLSHNNLTEDSSEALSKIIINNKSIVDLNLSWNGYFEATGNRKVFGALGTSDRIQTLNLAWNAISSNECVRPIAQYVRNSRILEFLDLSYNRMSGLSLRTIRNAIHRNTSLRVVKLGNNISSPEETHLLLTAFAGKVDHPLMLMDLENMSIRKESKAVLNRLNGAGKVVKIGNILSDYDIRGPNANKLIYDRCRYVLTKVKNPKAKKDFGHFILSLPDGSLTKEEFQKEIQRQKLRKLDKDLIEALMQLFTADKKTIDCVELVNDYMSFYPHTTLPPPKQKQKRDHKKKRKAKKE
ncbi:leucine-rich repeat-containing protein 74A-like isoform X2 [Cylas formicarius]|uniref:leucine-rich repeat-containing protein 74A-like isoform X2 n=1 Tax=Cylas formicarius TaxID=197179 RepID=UPI0029587370|nr:leucine-rich repeat-containing protein 74A-like isoform X2 [Cylas formicarius]